MELATMKALIAGLLAWIHVTAGYPTPQTDPVIALVPHGQLEGMACSGPCAVLGFYRDDGVVYLDGRLEIARNACAQSVLLHELVHYVQDLDGRFADQPQATRWQLRELEAHTIQRIFLAQQRRGRIGSWRLTAGAATGPTC